MARVELASLRHAGGIVEVHRSDLNSPRQWTEEGWREVSPVELDPCQWILNGGPWMSVETCAIHVNNLLLAGQTPLVALEGDRVVGEAEVILGDEGGRRGLVAHLSVIEVHRDFRGRGVGRSLVESALAVARDRGVEAVTVVPEEDAKGFYRATGFCPAERWAEVTASLGDLPEVAMEAELFSPSLGDFEGMELVVGRYQSGLNIALNVLEEFAGCDALGAGRSWRGVAEGVEFIAHVWNAPFLGEPVAYVWTAASPGRPLELESRVALSAVLTLAGRRVRTLIPEGLAGELGFSIRGIVEFWAREV